MTTKSINDHVEYIRQTYQSNYSKLRHLASSGNSLDYPEDEGYATNLLSGAEEEDDPFRSQIDLIESASSKEEISDAVYNAKRIIRNYKSLDIIVIENITDSLSLIEQTIE